MRPDVKLGIVVSTVFVTVAGTYFLIQDRRDSAIPVSSDTAALANAADKTPRNTTQPEPARTPNTGPRRVAAPSTKRTTSAPSGVQNPSARMANQAGKPKSNATPKRDRRAARPEQLVAGRGAKRSPAESSTQARRSRNGMQPQRKQARRKQPKMQLALTATPAAGTDGAVERHRVQQGDTMASLAKQYYGSTQFAAFLISRNRQLANPAQPRVGEVVNIVPRPNDGKTPTAGSKTAARKAIAPATREYRIKSGDSFYRIARDVLGDATRWTELFEMNKKLVGNDPAKLQIGQVIALPQR